MHRVKVPVELQFDDRLIEGSASIPAALMRPADLLPVLYGVGEAVIGYAAERAARGGKTISCRAGCAACCRQLVPVSEAEAFRLAEVIEAMPPERRTNVRERFRQVVAQVPAPILERLRDSSNWKDAAENTRWGQEYFRLGIACPFLEGDLCGIYPERPMACREYLVTSPAENCKSPSKDSIATVPMPVRPSAVLRRFDDGIGDQPVRWVPLALVEEFAAARRDAPQRTYDGPQMFRNFVSRIARLASGL